MSNRFGWCIEGKHEPESSACPKKVKFDKFEVVCSCKCHVIESKKDKKRTKVNEI